MAHLRERSTATGCDSDSSDHVGASRAWRLFAPPIAPISASMSWDSRSLPLDGFDPANSLRLSAVLSEFTSAWEQGQAPSIGAYLDRLDPADSRGAVELIYRDYCLAAAAGRKPDSTEYVCRFPRYAEALERVAGIARGLFAVIAGSPCRIGRQ